MRFGTQKETKTLDDNGSTITTEKNIKDFETTKPVRMHYERRIRVKDKKEELTEILRFSDSLNPKLMKDPAIRYEYTRDGDDKGYYYLILCHTELDYS